MNREFERFIRDHVTVRRIVEEVDENLTQGEAKTKMDIHDIDIVFNSSNPEKVLENAEAIMRDTSNPIKTRLRAELTYVQLGIINPLAKEFMEAAGIKEENNA